MHILFLLCIFSSISYFIIFFNLATDRGHKWDNIQTCRALFDEFAKQKGFDPLIEENWYSDDIHLTDILKMPGVSSKLQDAHNGLRNAIQKAYPEITFSKWTGRKKIKKKLTNKKKKQKIK